MSRKIVKVFVDMLGRNVVVRRDSEWEEYIVEFPSYSGTYHTDDKLDALATAQHYCAQDRAE